MECGVRSVKCKVWSVEWSDEHMETRVRFQIKIYGCYYTMVRTQKANQEPTTE